MIIFCEECGARNDLKSDNLGRSRYAFDCCECGETLMVSKPTLNMGGLNAFVSMGPEPAPEETQAPVSVLIVDDSLVLRKIVKEMFSADDRIQVVGEAENGLEALKLIPEVKPDVVTLDVNMPVMDGLTTIKHIMIKTPVPVVMFSTLTGQGALETFEALRYGAVDFLQKPSSLLREDLKSQHQLIVSRVKNAARAGIDTIRYLRPAPAVAGQASTGPATCQRVFAIGTSYGGYGSLLGLIPQLDPDLPAAFVCVLYAAPSHVDAFTRYLNGHSPMAVSRVGDGLPLCPGSCYLASASETVTLTGSSENPVFRVEANRIPRTEQAADAVMASISTALGERASGILLSGIGRDGIAGIGKILDGGGSAIVQAPQTCLCSDTTSMAIQKYGLPAVLPGLRMADAIRSHYLKAGQLKE